MARRHRIISFERLPYDIHFEIAKHMEYREILRLAATNRYLHSILNPRTILGIEKAIEFIAERDKHYREIDHPLFGCCNCLKFLPLKKFIKTNNFGWLPLSVRFCLDCTAALRLWPHLRPAMCADNGPLKYYFCHNCGEYRTKSERCRGRRIGPYTKQSAAAAARARCAQPRRPLQGIEKLPTYTLAKISSFLDFSDILKLSQVSRNLNDVVKPNDWTPLHTRYRFIHDRWTAQIQDLEFEEIQSFPCYRCFKLYSRYWFRPDHIQMAKKSPETTWKMHCYDCSIWRGMENTFSCIEYRRREMCETCGCIKYMRKTCSRCQELYVQGLIDWKTLYPRLAETEENLSLVRGLFAETC